MIKAIGIVVIGVVPLLTRLPAQVADASAISADRIRQHTEFLSSDLLEGRGVGQRGGEIAAEYIATQLALAGARPAMEDRKGWPQRCRWWA
jgi:hypothetical protein